MKLSKNQPFWTSVILHLVLLLGLFLATIVQAFKPKEKPHVFEMVEPPSLVSQAQPSTPLPPTAMEMPDVTLPPVPSVEIPQPPAPLPPTPSPSTPPKPKPQATETPKAKSPPKPAEEELVDYRDFRAKHPLNKPKPRPSPARQNIAVPQIDVPKLIIPRDTSSNSTSKPLSSQDLSALANYSARLRSKIDAAWKKPSQVAGVGLVAEVVFSVSATGQITNVRLRPGSGNAAFDQSILAAFRQATSAGPTPTGQSHEFSLPFSMADATRK